MLPGVHVQCKSHPSLLYVIHCCFLISVVKFSCKFYLYHHGSCFFLEVLCLNLVKNAVIYTDDTKCHVFLFSYLENVHVHASLACGT